MAAATELGHVYKGHHHWAKSNGVKATATELGHLCGVYHHQARSSYNLQDDSEISECSLRGHYLLEMISPPFIY